MTTVAHRYADAALTSMLIIAVNVQGVSARKDFTSLPFVTVQTFR